MMLTPTSWDMRFHVATPTHIDKSLTYSCWNISILLYWSRVPDTPFSGYLILTSITRFPNSLYYRHFLTINSRFYCFRPFVVIIVNQLIFWHVICSLNVNKFFKFKLSKNGERNDTWYNDLFGDGISSRIFIFCYSDNVRIQQTNKISRVRI